MYCRILLKFNWMQCESTKTVKWWKSTSRQIQNGKRRWNCAEIGILTISRSAHGPCSPKVLQRLGPRLSLKYWLRHFAHPCPNFTRSKKSPKFGLHFRAQSRLSLEAIWFGNGVGPIVCENENIMRWQRQWSLQVNSKLGLVRSTNPVLG